MKTFIICVLLSSISTLSLLMSGCDVSAVQKSAEGGRVIFATDFDNGPPGDWQPSDPNAWRIEDAGGNNVLSLFRQSDYEPPVRSPHNINILRNVVAGSFVMDVDVQSTTKDYPHQDLCIFFGYQDPLHFYYAHLGKQADPRSHAILVVDGKPRNPITLNCTEGTPWDEQWHHVRLVRDLRSGTIAVYFDESDDPVIKALDDRFACGLIGVGSFDDTGRFDNIALRTIKGFQKVAHGFH